MATGNLGIKKKDLEDGSPIGIAVAAPEDRDKEEQEKVHYPSFTLTNKHIEAAGLKDAAPDEVYEFTVRARVVSVKKKAKDGPRYDDNRTELEVQDISDVTMTEGGDSEEDSEEKKDMDGRMGFDTGTLKKKQAPIGPKAAGLKLK